MDQDRKRANPDPQCKRGTINDTAWLGWTPSHNQHRKARANNQPTGRQASDSERRHHQQGRVYHLLNQHPTETHTLAAVHIFHLTRRICWPVMQRSPIRGSEPPSNSRSCSQQHRGTHSRQQQYASHHQQQQRNTTTATAVRAERNGQHKHNQHAPRQRRAREPRSGEQQTRRRDTQHTIAYNRLASITSYASMHQSRWSEAKRGRVGRDANPSSPDHHIEVSTYLTHQQQYVYQHTVIVSF